MHNDFGPQGGDVDDSIVLDLSTCVNPYGPAPAAVDALHNADPSLLKRHPYRATEDLEEAYAARLSVESESLVAVRGASEAIWQISKLFASARVALPLPAYTEFLSAFTHATPIPPVSFWHTIAQLENAAEHHNAVVFSNPHNPTGRSLERDELLALFVRHPQCTFVVDESYADFVPAANSDSVVGCDTPNVIVLRSPTKFFGLGGVRVGIVWTPSSIVRLSLVALRTTWPISRLDTSLIKAVFADESWQFKYQAQLAQDGQWLDSWLAKQPNIDVVQSPLHFRLITGDVDSLETLLSKEHIAVRRLEERHGLGVPALRITAPAVHERHLLPS